MSGTDLVDIIVYDAPAAAAAPATAGVTITTATTTALARVTITTTILWKKSAWKCRPGLWP